MNNYNTTDVIELRQTTEISNDNVDFTDDDIVDTVIKKTDVKEMTKNENVTSACKDTCQKEILVIGDSNLKRLDTYITKIDNIIRNRVSIVALPGGKIENFIDIVPRVLNGYKGKNLMVMLHLGVNDTVNHSEVFVYNYERLLNLIVETIPKVEIVICGMPLRIDKGDLVYSRTYDLNYRLLSLSKSYNCKFIQVYSLLSDCKYWTKDGLHYNKFAASIVGGELRKVIVNFLTLVGTDALMI